jgi:hypothetical protein
MKAIHKFSLGALAPGEVDVRMPAGARVLSVGIQGVNKGPAFEQVVVWATVDTTTNLRAHQLFRFRKLYTGSPFERRPGDFIGTVQAVYPEGEIVLHVFQSRVVETADGTIIEVV